MHADHDLGEATEAAWTSFRGRLADHVAEMADDDVLVVELAGVVDAHEGAAPYVQLVAFGDGLVQAEAASNAYLDERFELDVRTEDDLLDLGWEEPLDEPGWENFHLTAERREADRVAVLLVRTLREVYGVPHPAFLGAGGLEVDPDAPSYDEPVVAVDDESRDTEVVVVPHSSEELVELVDEAMREVFPDLRHDSDGDIPVRDGLSTLFIRVLPDRPAVELFAEVVVGPDDLDRVTVEVGLLNAAHPLWKFVHRDDAVVMRHEIVALPFSANQLRMLVRQFLDDLDRVAHELVLRVGGRRFLERPPAEAEPPVSAPADAGGLVLTGLLELCHLGRPRAATVAGLFGHDRLEIIRQIVRIRTGQQQCGEHDPDVVLTALRKALRLVSDGEPERPRAVPPPGPRSVQASLLDDGDVGEDSLDLGWPA